MDEMFIFNRKGENIIGRKSSANYSIYTKAEAERVLNLNNNAEGYDLYRLLLVSTSEEQQLVTTTRKVIV